MKKDLDKLIKDFWCNTDIDGLTRDFSKTYDLNIESISDAQYFHLAYIVSTIMDNNYLKSETIEDYKKSILHFLQTGYVDYNNENELFYNPDLAEDLYLSVREVFGER